MNASYKKAVNLQHCKSTTETLIKSETKTAARRTESGNC